MAVTTRIVNKDRPGCMQVCYSALRVMTKISCGMDVVRALIVARSG
jgi:hypothetical protein